MAIQQLDSVIVEKAEKWLGSNIDNETRTEIERLMNNADKADLTEAFYKDLEFGTGGLRGIMGVGSNRMNKYTVGMATQGLANYLKKVYQGEDMKVVIAYDSRNNSKFFAETTAAVFSANGFTVYLFEDLRPTPELSFAIRYLKAHSGVVLTASHNPKEYNGYKAYWNDGAQMIAPHDKNVIGEVNKINSIDDVKFNADLSKIKLIGEEIDNAYLDTLESLSVAKEAIKNQKDLKIVFTPIHGTSITLVPKILERLGFENVHVVEEQARPDGNFPTVVYPNPEEPEALSIALQKAKDLDADLVMACDPDADRVGIAVKNHKNEWQLVNGNQTGSLLIYYMLDIWQKARKLDGNQFIVKTVVTTDLIERIAKHYHVDCYNTLTGFKFIAAVIKELEGKKTFIAGGEESYGYLIGDKVRDKDAVASCAMIAEMVAYAKDRGMSLFDMLLEMYIKFGFFHEKLLSLTKKGIKGSEEIQEMMKEMRSNPPRTIDGKKIIKLIDYQSSTEKDLISGIEKNIDYPKSNVLQFITEDESKISARPSGTEPKIKFYFSVNEKLSSKEDYDKVEKQLNSKIEKIVEELKLK